MKIVWTPEAQQDRLAIWDYIVAENPRAAVRMDTLFSECAARLAQHPRMGHAGLIAGTFELIPHQSYRLVYELDEETVWVLALVHTSTSWPALA